MKDSAGTIKYLYVINELESLPHNLYKKKLSIDVCVRIKNLNYVKEKRGENISDLGLATIFK